MKLLLSYWCLHRSMIGLLAVVRVRRSPLPRLGPAAVAHPSPFQVRVDGAASVADLSRYRVTPAGIQRLLWDILIPVSPIPAPCLGARPGRPPWSGSSVPCFHAWGLRSSLTQVHSMFASTAPEMLQVFPPGDAPGMTRAGSQGPLSRDHLLLLTSPITA